MTKTESQINAETLTCHACGHVITTAKTIGKSETLEVKCPKCHASENLANWRTRSAITINSDIEGEKTPIDQWKKIRGGNQPSQQISLLEGLVGTWLIITGFVGVLGSALAVAGSFFAFEQKATSTDQFWGELASAFAYFAFFMCVIGFGVVVNRVVLLPIFQTKESD